MGVHLLTSCKMFQRGKSSPLWDDATHVESLKSTNFTVLVVSKAFWCGFVWSLSRKLWIMARSNALDSNAKQTWCYCLICQKSCRHVTFRLVSWCGILALTCDYVRCNGGVFSGDQSDFLFKYVDWSHRLASRIERSKWAVLTSRAGSHFAATHVSDKRFWVTVWQGRNLPLGRGKKNQRRRAERILQLQP